MSALGDDGVIARRRGSVLVTLLGFAEERPPQRNIVDADWSLRLIGGEEKVRNVFLIPHCRQCLIYFGDGEVGLWDVVYTVDVIDC